jgi:hypothetical protein
VNDKDPATRFPRDFDALADGLVFGFGGFAFGVIDIVCQTGVDQVGDVFGDDFVIFGVDQQHAASFLETFRNTLQVLRADIESILTVGHVTLDGRRPLRDDQRDLVQGLGCWIRDAWVHPPIYQRQAVRFFPLVLEGINERFTVLLVGEINNGGYPSIGGGEGAGIVIVHADGAHKDVVKVDVGIHRAGQHKEAAGVERDIGFEVRQVAYGSYTFPLDENVLLRDGLPQNDSALSDQGCLWFCHQFLSLLCRQI